MTIFSSVEALTAALQGQGYLADRATAVALFLAGRIEKPLLLALPDDRGTILPRWRREGQLQLRRGIN